MSRRKTNEEYVADVAAINPDIEIVDKYIDAKTKILHRCKIDGYEWYVRPHDILQGSGCPVCSKCKKYTHNEYVTMVSNINSNIKVIDKYINIKTKILHRCIICGNEWTAIPSNILHGNGCPICSTLNASSKRLKTHEQYVIEVEKINFNIEVIEQYVNSRTPILHKCKIDGCVWYASPNNILKGHGCPKCNVSNGEKSITNWLNEKHILYESQKRFNDCRDKQPLPFDFYLPVYNMAIEYNGIQHYKSIDYFGGEEVFKYTIKHDKIKENYCKENNIRLFIIPYFEDINIKLKELGDLIIAKEVAA